MIFCDSETFLKNDDDVNLEFDLEGIRDDGGACEYPREDHEEWDSEVETRGAVTHLEVLDFRRLARRCRAYGRDGLNAHELQFN